MDPSRLTQGQKIAGGAGLILLISLWLSWYGADLGGLADSIGIDATVNAWGAFDLVDIVLFLTALAALALAALAASNTRVDLPVAPALIVAGLGVLSVLLILYRILNQPGPNELIDVKFGAFIGLLSAAGVAYGGIRWMSETGAAPAGATPSDPGRTATAPPAATTTAPAPTPETSAPAAAPPAATPPAAPPEPPAPPAPPAATTPDTTTPAVPPADPPPPEGRP